MWAIIHFFITRFIKLSNAGLCLHCLFYSEESMETYVSLIQSYTGRDKILRTVGYVATLLSGSVRYEETSKKLVSISRQISNSRAILRFFDDILMWRITRHLSVEVRYVLLF